MLDRSLLLIEYVASTASNHDIHNAMSRKEKSSLPAPVSHSSSRFGRVLVFTPMVRSFAYGDIDRRRYVSNSQPVLYLISFNQAYFMYTVKVGSTTQASRIITLIFQ